MIFKTIEEAVEFGLFWQKIAMKRGITIQELSDYIDELEVTINILNAEMEEV